MNIVVEKVKGNEGDKIKITEVNLVNDGNKVLIGSPLLDNVVVEGTIKKHFKGDKVIAYKYKPKKGYHRKVGHRQQLTLLSLEKISINS
jgi:large subunit ribosomal protein L21